jgi:hypothetical protein
MDAWDIQTEPVQFTKKKEIKIESFTLNVQQQALISNRWKDTSREPPSIQELLDICFPNQKLDGRSRESILIKEFLVKNGASKQNITIKEIKHIELSDEQKEYITNNSSNMKPIEMARILFNNPKILPGSLEVKKVNEFYRTLDLPANQMEEAEYEYRAPSNPERVVLRIKKYIKECEDWDAKKLSPVNRKQVNSLRNYLYSHRFKYQMDLLESVPDKELFESSFIKYCYDKEDLTQENVDQYILLCSEIVNQAHIQRNIDLLQREQDRVISEEGKLSMTVVEAIKTSRQEHNECVKRQQALYKSLTQERSDRLDEEVKDKASLLSLINAWKNYETRQQILKLAGQKKDTLRKELHELANLDEMKMRILGISIDEVVNG